MSEPVLSPVDVLAANLQRLLQEVLDQPLSAEARIAASQAHALAISLCQQLVPQPEPSLIDRTVFDALLKVAGSETAPKLLDQVLLDLGCVRQALDHALPTADWAELRLQSHILMSIAGSFGAMQLCRDAEALNRLAHAGDASALSPLDLRLQQGLVALMQFLQDEARSLPSPQPKERPSA
ncbi:hypothetical protein [Pseudotabrizicola sp. L79]|uniref:hypothetical protein n=1 Tax=Pseudotabrizicola sp. L79 TaxID=3118402 RepID=UPI002F940644